ncbi:MAG: hypothetical protein NTV34_19110, partial [Proteobacteria bacterium]|nr:hypothetical protein [Pseudomonadota bacterium]
LYFIIVSTIVAINTILNPSVAAASTESQYGKELKIAQDPVTEKLSFGAVYTLDADPDGMSLLITFRTNISDEELKSLPDNLHWNIIGPRDIAVPVTVQDAVIPKSALKVGVQYSARRSVSESC